MVDVHGGCRESGDAIEDGERQQMESATRYIPSWATATLKYGAGTLGNRKMHLQDGGTVTMMKSTSFSCAAKHPQQGGVGKIHAAGGEEEGKKGCFASIWSSYGVVTTQARSRFCVPLKTHFSLTATRLALLLCTPYIQLYLWRRQAVFLFRVTAAIAIIS